MIEAFLELQHIINLSFMEMHSNDSTQVRFHPPEVIYVQPEVLFVKTCKENVVLPELPDLVKMQKMPFPAHIKESGSHELITSANHDNFRLFL